MRVPLEVLRIILNAAVVASKFKHLFMMRLASRLFNDEVLDAIFNAKKIHILFRMQSNHAWRDLPVTLQRRYLRFCIHVHHKCPTLFSTLFFRSYAIHRGKMCVDDSDDQETRERIMNDMLNDVDVRLLHTNCIGNQWIFFIRGHGLDNWLKTYDEENFHTYPDVNENLRLYLLLRSLIQGPANSRLTYHIKEVLDTPVAPDYELDFASDIIQLAVARGWGWSAKQILDSRRAEPIRNFPLKDYIEIAALRNEIGLVACLILQLIGGDDVGLTMHNRILYVFSSAIIQAVGSGNTDVSAWLIERLGECETVGSLHGLFVTVWHEDYQPEKNYTSLISIPSQNGQVGATLEAREPRAKRRWQIWWSKLRK